MAFNKRILHKLEDACDGNRAMLNYMTDLVTFEMQDVKQYKSTYEDFLKSRAKEEVEEATD